MRRNATKPKQAPANPPPVRRVPLGPASPSQAELKKMTPEGRRERHTRFDREFQEWWKEVERVRLAALIPGERAHQAWESALDSALAKAEEPEPVPAAPPTSASEPERATPRRTPGKPPTNDWKKYVARELIRIAAIDDEVPSAAEMCEWCATACGYQPDVRAMQKYLKEMLAP